MSSLQFAKKMIMLQGTASDTGKSFIVTALCRILARNNKKVSPFKSWNMSLNSYVTGDGGEIGIAQAIQAKAAGEEPVISMQPILVKPKGNGLSQVIMNGKPLGDFKYGENDNQYVKEAKKIIKNSLDRLKKRYEYVIIEGAGSPAEINRKNEDLANMIVAKFYSTPVILVADIDKGGVFASLVGTMELLEPEERNLVRGFIINKFRGDIDILQPGIDFLERRTGKPVIGVIPYIDNVKLPEEDSASLILKNLHNREKNNIKIGVINLPHISNFTDFKSLELENHVSLKYINNVEEMTDIDMIIIPGTKTTTADLNYLKKSGLSEKISEAADKGIPVIGICGGYQMMGETLLDKYQTEGGIREIQGLGLLPVDTKFLPGKTTHQVKAEFNIKPPVFKDITDDQLTGYEIHMGETYYKDNAKPLFIIKERSRKQVSVGDGAFSTEGNCFGTYMHGLFNNDNFRKGILNMLRMNKGLKLLDGDETSYYDKMEEEFERLADIVGRNLDMDYLYSLLD